MERITNSQKRERLSLISECIKMATPTLLAYPDQLITQLQGRMVTLSPEFSEEIVRLADQNKETWLKLLFPSLGKPGGALKMTLQNEEEVMAVRISDQANRVACLFSDYVVKVWDLKKSSVIFESPAEMGMSALGFSNDGKLIAFTNEDCDETLVMDVDLSKKLATVQGEANQIFLKQDGKVLFWSNDEGIFTQSIEKKDQTCLVRQSGIIKFCVNENADMIVIVKNFRSSRDDYDFSSRASSNKNVVIILNPKNRTQSVLAEDLPVNRLVINQDGSVILVGNEDGTIHVFSGVSKRRKFILKGHTEELYAVVVSADGSRAVSGASDNLMKIWDLNLGKESASIPTSSILQTLDMTEDGKTIVSGCFDGTIQIWDVENAIKEKGTKSQPQLGQVDRIRLARSGTLAAIQKREEKISLMDLAADAIPKSFDQFVGKLWDFTGKYLLISQHKELVLIDIANNNREVCKIREPHHISDAVIVSPTYLAAVNGDPAIHIWKANNVYKKIPIIDEEKQAEYRREAGKSRMPMNIATGSLKISPDGKFAITNLSLNPPSLWDLASGNKIRTFDLSNFNGIVYSWDVDKDFGLIVLVGKRYKIDKGLIVGIKVDTGKETYMLEVDDIPNRISISADGGKIIAGFSNGSMKYYLLQSGKDLGTFSGDTPFEEEKVSHDGSLIVALESSGLMHRLVPSGLSYSK